MTRLFSTRSDLAERCPLWLVQEPQLNKQAGPMTWIRFLHPAKCRIRA